VLHIQQWEVLHGEQVLLRGVSGSGKTTLLNIIAGLLTPTEGQVWFRDKSLYALPESRRDRFRAGNIGYIYQMHHLLPALTALENVVMPLAFARQNPAREWKKRAQHLLECVGLAEFQFHRPAQLSAGQRLRVAVARALAVNPPVVLADEPTAALDQDSGALVMNFIQDTCRQHHCTLITASHDPALAWRFDSIYDLMEGRLIQQEKAPT
jgi:putative ABC transport system ATP-binding protein